MQFLLLHKPDFTKANFKQNNSKELYLPVGRRSLKCQSYPSRICGQFILIFTQVLISHKNTYMFTETIDTQGICF